MNTSSVHHPDSEIDTDLFPTSFAQQRLWLLDQLEPNSVAYNLLWAVRINISLNVEALERSLNAIIQRHEILRTIFVAKDGQPMQMIIPRLTVPLPLVNLQHLSETEQETEMLRLMNEEAQHPLDLSHGPLLRTTLLRLKAQEHVLIMSIHHIIFDGWSGGVFFRELIAFYETFANDQPSTLPDLPVQYADFAVWQREALQGERLATQLAYWKKQLAGAPTILTLPTDRPRPSTLTNRGSNCFFKLPTSLSEALKALSHQEGVSLFMTLVASFQTLLYRYSGQEDILLGTATAERSQAELEHLIGFFINTLVLRTDLSGNPTFRELLKRVREVTLEANAYQDVPFEYLVKELQPDRLLGQNPFFQVLLTLEPPEPILPAGWAFPEMDIKTSAAKFDLSLEISDRPDGLVPYLEYNADLFDEATIVRMVEHWQTLLEGIVANPSQRLLELPLLTEAERHQLLVDWNATEMAYPKDRGIHQLFEEQVERTPDAVAVVFEQQRLTYRELNVRVNQLAHHLQQLGVEPEMLVGICVERSMEMVVGLLGILKAGGAYVPLDPTFPPERLTFMLEDAQVSVLLTQQHLIERLPKHEAKVVCLDTEWKAIAQESEENLTSDIIGENLAYMLYTSGSTGRPKGVLATHRAALNRFNWMWETYPFESAEVCCQKTSLSFVDSVWEIFGPLLQGIRIVIIPDAVINDPEQMLQTLAAHSVTRIVLVPSLLQVLLDTKADIQNQLPDLKYWVSSGEALPLQLTLRFLNSMPKSVLINLYGSSEVAADATCYDTRNSKSQTCVPIGRPIANTQIYLLDRHMQLVPIGVPGELHIGGDGLARGYFNRSELTAEKFVPNPFRPEPRALLYKTGDWARYLPDGDIEYLGRLDHQVKIHGFRIELGEIEAVLGEHPALRQAVVVAREDVPGDKRLVAYVVLHKRQTASIGDLQRHVMKHLPVYMIPFVFVLLEALPLMPNGKVNRLALPAPDRTHFKLETFVAPQTQMEEVMVGIWSQMLGIEQVGIHDNFFVLGGHSLLAMQIISRLRVALEVELPLRFFFEAPTIAELAERAKQLKANGTTTRMPPLRAISRQRHRTSLSGEHN